MACVARRASSGDPIDMDAIHDYRMPLAVTDPGGSRLPPIAPSLKERFRPLSRLRLFGRILDFLVAAENDDRLPMVPVLHIVDLQADQRVGAHPVDLLADRGKPIDAPALGVEREMDWHYVGLVVLRASQPSEVRSFQNFRALRGCQLVNQHTIRTGDMKKRGASRVYSQGSCSEAPAQACVGHVSSNGTTPR